MPRTRQLKDILKKINKKIAPNDKRRDLISVDGNLCFWIHNGPVLKNLTDFNQALKMMNDEQFSYHVNHEKNDFARWIADALQDPKLAQSLQSVHGREAALHVTQNHLMSEYGLTT